MLPRAGQYATDANNALALFFGLGEDGSDDDELPDHAAEHQRYREAAAAYRQTEDARRSGSPATAAIARTEGTGRTGESVDGTWSISYRAGGGEKTADIVLTTADGNLTGTFDGITIKDAHLANRTVSFTAKLTAPFPMKMRCTGTVDGDTITGSAKVPMMTFPFTGSRTA